MGFEIFENHWEITGILNMETPLRIGTSLALYSTSSAPVLLQYDGKNEKYEPFIPGSSLKGVLRATAERILNTHGHSKAIVDTIFGSQNGGAKIKVRDSHIDHTITMDHTTEQRPHAGKNTRFRTEEVIPPIRFRIQIDVDNANDVEISLILKCLDEFNHKRAHIGGGVSRGYGFVSISELKVIKKTPTNLDHGEEKNAEELKSVLKLSSHGSPVIKDTFDYYYAAHTYNLEGCIVCEFQVVCETKFKMPGVEEPTVTMLGQPVIPGSTIKGWLREKFFRSNLNRDRVFGSAQKNGARSRVLISDAFSDKKFTTNDHLPAGEILKCWVVFDNLKQNEISQILNVMKNGDCITGRRTARQTGNRVRFELVKAWKYTLTDPVYVI